MRRETGIVVAAEARHAQAGDIRAEGDARIVSGKSSNVMTSA
jgi:hypothetical protein